MTESILHRHWFQSRLFRYLFLGTVVFLSLVIGQTTSPKFLVIVFLIVGGIVLLNNPNIGLLLVTFVALVVRTQFDTGTDVSLTSITLFIPFLGIIWFADMAVHRRLNFRPSRLNLPLFIFILMSLLSLIIGRVTWDPLVHRNKNFILVQMSQWGIFALSGLAFWLSANIIRNERDLERFTWSFLSVGGVLALLTVVIGVDTLIGDYLPIAIIRPPFWILLTGLAAGQLLYNPKLSRWKVAFLISILMASFIYAFIQQRESVSNWIGVGVTLLMLLWIRYPRTKWIALLIVVVAAITGILWPTVYNFAGGDVEWQTSGRPRLVLIERVVEVTMRNPITGLGPASYRAYSGIEPLPYRNAIWTYPQVSSHNNWVDIFAQVGLLGVAIFLWFSISVIRSAANLGKKASNGFRRGFANGMLALWIGALSIMMLADWILPFVYNISFEGFPASALVWFFLGGIVALENI